MASLQVRCVSLEALVSERSKKAHHLKEIKAQVHAQLEDITPAITVGLLNLFVLFKTLSEDDFRQSHVEG